MKVWSLQTKKELSKKLLNLDAIGMENKVC